MYMSKNVSAAVKRRRAVEKRIVLCLIDELLEQGFELDVDDGGEIIKCGTRREAVVAAVMNTDEDILHVRKGSFSGWVKLVYGNDGYDVISDYTCNLQSLEAKYLSKTLALAERLA